MVSRNDLLTQARELTPSRVTPDVCMSRQELADLANAWLLEAKKRTAELDANYIGKLERGVIRWPQAPYREALREILGVQTDRELGLYPSRRRAATVNPVRKRQLLKFAAAGVGALVTAPLHDLFTLTTPTPVPNKVGRTEIDQITAATETFKKWDNTFGGGLAREAVAAQLRWSAQLLQSECDSRLEPQLFAAVGSLAGVTGFMAFDACAHDDARRMFGFALDCAEESKDWHLRAMPPPAWLGRRCGAGTRTMHLHTLSLRPCAQIDLLRPSEPCWRPFAPEHWPSSEGCRSA